MNESLAQITCFIGLVWRNFFMRLLPISYISFWRNICLNPLPLLKLRQLLVFFVFFFGCSRSQLQHAGPSLLCLGYLIVALGLLVATRSIQVPDQESNSGPPALGAQSLNHWSTREIPRYLSFCCCCFIPSGYQPLKRCIFCK